MNHTLKTKLLFIACITASCLSSCHLEPLDDDWKKEEYTRSFIKNFGLIDQEQDWNMAKSAVVTLNLGTKPAKVKIYADYGNNYYLVADLDNVAGKIDVPIDVPKSCAQVMVKVNNRKFYGDINKTIDCSGASRGVPDVEYGVEDDGGGHTDTYNPNPPVYTNTVGTYSVEVRHTTSGNGAQRGFSDNGEYQYFNTQQMAPVVSTEEWSRYYSLNTGLWTDNPYAGTNTQKGWGILPERAVFNVGPERLTNWLNSKRNEGEDIVEDFVITTGDDGSFTLFPYYYGTNYEHELGVYIIDENDNPVLRSGTYNPANDANYKLSDFISFKIFRNRQHGDLQTKPKFDSSITDIRLKDGATKFNFVVGKSYDLGDYVEVKVGGDWILYNTYMTPAKAASTHTRLAVHFWGLDEEPTNPWITFNDFSHITVNATRGDSYGAIGVATGVAKQNTGKTKITGPFQNISYQITATGDDDPLASSSSGGGGGSGGSETYTPELNSIEWGSWTPYGVEKEAIDEYNFRIKVTQTGTYEIPITCSDQKGEYMPMTDELFAQLSVDPSGTGNYQLSKGSDNRIYLTITSIDDTTNDHWVHIYHESNGTAGYQGWDASASNDDNANPAIRDLPDLSFAVKVVASGTNPNPGGTTTSRDVTHSYSETFTTLPTISGVDWSTYFTSSSEIEYVQAAAQIIGINVDNSMVPQSIKDDFYVDNVWYENRTIDNVEKNLFNEIFRVFQNMTPAEFRTWYQSLNSPNITEVTGGNVVDLTAEYHAIYTGLSWESSSHYDSPSDHPYFNGGAWYGFGIFFEKVTTSTPVEKTKYTWKSSMIDDAETALAAYYTAQGGSSNHQCSAQHEQSSDCSGWKDFSSATATVTINDPTTAKDDYTNASFTVTYTFTEPVNVTSKPRFRASTPARAVGRRAAKASRADDGVPALLSTAVANDPWVDASSYWTLVLPMGQEVSSYPPNMTMLGRSCGYDIKIMHNGVVYNGKLGVYLKVVGDNYAADDSWNTDAVSQVLAQPGGTATHKGVKFPYVQFSQRRFNRNAEGGASGQISSLTFKHPVTKRTFMSFEDMLVTNSTHSPIGEGDNKRNSTDRDVNDLIFNITNFAAVSGGGVTIKERQEYDSGFPWIWAVEDLGSMDDFDFNDVVVRITSITKMQKWTEPVTSGEGDSEETTDVPHGSATKQLTFTPLAAGGTLPLYIHFKTAGLDFVLRPGQYDISTAEARTTTYNQLKDIAPAAEIHQWFGSGYPNTTMINTGAGPNVAESNIMSCVLIVEAPTFHAGATLDTSTFEGGFRLNTFSVSPGATADNKTYIDENNDTYFYAEVNGYTGQAEIYDEQLKEKYPILNGELGAAPQSFIVIGESWRWPKERKHILEAYPNFGEWVSDKNNNTWISVQGPPSCFYK